MSSGELPSVALVSSPVALCFFPAQASNPVPSKTLVWRPVPPNAVNSAGESGS